VKRLREEGESEENIPKRSHTYCTAYGLEHRNTVEFRKGW
jgi:hypothetical protein